MQIDQTKQALTWLKEKVFPLWIEKGVDSTSGAFVENISFDGMPLTNPRRALVQARQIYSFVEALKLNILDMDTVVPLLETAVGNLIRRYSLPSGAFIHSVNVDGTASNQDVDLYTQAFVLFGLAQAYDVLRADDIKHAALKLLKYLNTERNLKHGGFSEIKNSIHLFQSNPHMHLFEAAIVWAKIDTDPKWRTLAIELYKLCTDKFIDSKAGYLAEHFDETWQPLLEGGHFVFEPGHHYEWAWLMIQFEKVTTIKVVDQPRRLFNLAEKFGVTANRELAVDEVLSSGQVKKASSRFWPQCERIKAAVILDENQVADVAMTALFKNFILLDKGMWRDTLLASGEFDSQPAKASSLYHIINAISEYVAP